MNKMILTLALASITILAEPFEAQCSRDNSKEVVVCKDKIFGTLMWQDDSMKNKKRLAPNELKAYCQNLTHAGYSDWRLPYIKELITLVKFQNKKDAEVEFLNSAFKNVTDEIFKSFVSGTIDSYFTIFESYYELRFDDLHMKGTSEGVAKCVREVR